ncbi:MAG: insulinase family protein [Candidatus Moduliflexus flocculans]|nr:insulinase family protein [Candidatus Moduliflexus flocculans]
MWLKRHFSGRFSAIISYGRPVEGSVETIDTLTRDDVANFYRDHYRPDNAVLSVVGDVTQEELKDLLGSLSVPMERAGEPGQGRGRQAR